MRQNMAFSTWHFQQKCEKISGPPPQTLSRWGGGYPLPAPHPLQRLRHLDPSHSKILGMPLSAVDCTAYNEDVIDVFVSNLHAC